MTYVIAEPCIDVPEDALPRKWDAFTPLNAAWLESADAVNARVTDYCERNPLPAIEGQR